MKRISVLFALLLVNAACNGIRYDRAEKRGVQVPTREELGEALKVSGQHSPYPTTLSAFLWPDEEFVSRWQGRGVIDPVLDYESYLEMISTQVANASDEYDRLVLDGIALKKQGAAELEEIDHSRDILLERDQALSGEWVELEGRVKSSEEMVESLGQRIQEGEGRLKSLKSLPADEQAGVDELNSELTSLRAEMGAVESGLAVMLNRQDELDQENNELMDQMDVLDEREDEIAAVEEAILPLQIAQGEIIYYALDPQYLQPVMDDNGEPVLDEEGNPEMDFDNDRRVNWVQTSENGVGSDNYLDIAEGKIEIRFKSWSGQAYETIYQQNEAGAWELHPESAIYDVSFSSDEVLEFKFWELDHRGNETGRIFEFLLERSPFAHFSRLSGDMLVRFDGEVVRRGQCKILLPGLDQ